jgi:hypothetical protein
VILRNFGTELQLIATEATQFYGFAWCFFGDSGPSGSTMAHTVVDKHPPHACHWPCFSLSQLDTTRTTVRSESQALGIEQNIKSTWRAHGTVLA